MKTTRLTTGEYWEAGYATQSDATPLEIEGFRNFGVRQVAAKIESLVTAGASVLEIGAGNSAFLSFLARRHTNEARFCGLDYSSRGCEMLRRRAEVERAAICVVQQDFLQPASDLERQFDLVYSVGVAEHFSSLPEALVAMRRFLSSTGRMLTVIPNMAGVLGRLTRRYNRAVYELHVPHDLESFIRGHVDADLQVESSGYLCSNNFGVLSSCFSGPSDYGWKSYLWLSRLTKMLWLFEANFVELPHSAALSPYLFAVSRAKR